MAFLAAGGAAQAGASRAATIFGAVFEAEAKVIPARQTGEAAAAIDAGFARAAARFATEVFSGAAPGGEAAFTVTAARGSAEAEILLSAREADTFLADLSGIAADAVAAGGAIRAASSRTNPIDTTRAGIDIRVTAESDAAGCGAIGRAIRTDHDHGGDIGIRAAELEVTDGPAGFATAATGLSTRFRATNTPGACLPGSTARISAALLGGTTRAARAGFAAGAAAVSTDTGVLAARAFDAGLPTPATGFPADAVGVAALSIQTGLVRSAAGGSAGCGLGRTPTCPPSIAILGAALPAATVAMFAADIAIRSTPFGSFGVTEPN